MKILDQTYKNKYAPIFIMMILMHTNIGVALKSNFMSSLL